MLPGCTGCWVASICFVKELAAFGYALLQVVCKDPEMWPNPDKSSEHARMCRECVCAAGVLPQSPAGFNSIKQSFLTDLMGYRALWPPCHTLIQRTAI